MLALDTERQLCFDVRDFVGRSIGILGITGSGKTNTSAVLIEELLTSGLPLTICDIEGEYWGLKEAFDLLIAGRSAHAELPLEPENAAQLAEVSLQRGISVILDLSDYTQDEASEILLHYFRRLWEIAGQLRKPYQIVLEECHEWLPQGSNSPLKQTLTRLALRGRKRGLGTILLSQRSAKVDKDVLTQASLLFLHRVVHPTDMKVYKDLLPLASSTVEEMVNSLQPGHAIVLSQHQPHVVHIRQRSTFHAGSTPEFGETKSVELRRIDEAMLQELRALLVPAQQSSHDPTARLVSRIQTLEELLAEKDALIQQQAEQIALLSHLRVSLDCAPAEAYLSPEQLVIAQASISSATIHHLSQAEGVRGVGAPLELSPDKTEEMAPNAYASSPSTVETIQPPGPALNEKKWAIFTRWLNTHSTPAQRRLLQTLHEYDKALSVYDLSAWSGIAESTIRNHPPLELIKRGLMTRTQHADGFRYASTLRAYLQREFPGMDHELLLKRLFTDQAG